MKIKKCKEETGKDIKYYICKKHKIKFIKNCPICKNKKKEI